MNIIKNIKRFLSAVLAVVTMLATILYRASGSPAVSGSSGFADAAADAYYADAVNWALSNGIVNGKGGNLFDPQGNATRAEVAAILRNYMTLTPENPTEKGKTLVVYFSGSGLKSIPAHP